MTTSKIRTSRLRAWTTSLLQAAGAHPEAAQATAEALVYANCRGLDSHGVALLAIYLPRLRGGAMKPDARPEIVFDLPGLTLIDGHQALGAYVATFAMNSCCDKAKTAGAAVAVVRNSTHFGAASCYSDIAARRGLVGVVLTNTDAAMGPVGTLRPVLGTNPLAIAAPDAPGVPLPSLDIATSVVAQGKIILAARANKEIPDGWGLGPDGSPTRDPREALANSVLPMGGHKGFALAFMIDVLAGCLSGGRASPDIHDELGVGHFIIAVDTAALVSAEEYRHSLASLTQHVHNAPRAAGTDPFMIPGEREARIAAERSTEIPFDPTTTALLRSLGDDLGIPFPA